MKRQQTINKIASTYGIKKVVGKKFSRALPLPPAQKPKTLLINLESTIVDIKYFIVFHRNIKPADVTFKVKWGKVKHEIHLYKRPKLDEFIETMSKLYDIGKQENLLSFFIVIFL